MINWEKFALGLMVLMFGALLFTMASFALGGLVLAAFKSQALAVGVVVIVDVIAVAVALLFGYEERNADRELS